MRHFVALALIVLLSVLAVLPAVADAAPATLAKDTAYTSKKKWISVRTRRSPHRDYFMEETLGNIPRK